VKTPLLWIRGHQPYYSKWTTVRSKSLVEAGPMPIVGLDFGTGWIAGNFNPGYKNDKRRYVKGFISESRYEELMDPCIAQKISTQKDQIVFESLVANIAAIPAEDILVINQHLATTYQISGENVVIWESLGFSHHHFQVFSSAEEMVEHLAAYLDRNGYSKTSKLHLIPYTTEDQGAAFIQSLSKLENATVTYLYRPFDLVDLRLQLN
jgi:hypothetical protein